MPQPRFLAFDIGAESGRAFAGALAGGGLCCAEVYRFANDPVQVRDTLFWDVLGLYRHVLEGMRRYVERYGPEVDGIGIDTWGVDFGLLDRDGNLLQNPVHHRDRRTEGMVAQLDRLVPPQEAYVCTGMEPSPITSACQLLALRRSARPVLDAAHRFLMIPDLLAYFLTGTVGCERTNAVSTQLYDARTGQWSAQMIGRLGLPRAIFPDLVDPGTVLGPLDGRVGGQVGLVRAAVIAPCTHDTAAAVAAVPGAGEGIAFISCGSWSILGFRADRLYTSPAALGAGIANELTYRGGFACRNLAGLWLVQQARAAWARQGTLYSYDELVALAAAAPGGGPLIDVAEARFLAPQEMTATIRDWCRRTDQAAPETPGQYVRCILESLALAYRQGLEALAGVRGRGFEALHLVGGGSRNPVLCGFVAGATGLPLVAGPLEATVRGNLLTQAAALGFVQSAAEIRDRVRRSTALEEYAPADRGYWDDRCAAFLRLREKDT